MVGNGEQVGSEGGAKGGRNIGGEGLDRSVRA